MNAIEQPILPLTPTNGSLTPAAADGTDGTTNSTPASVPFDASILRDYLLALLPPMFGAQKGELEAQIFDPEFEERVARFAAEGGNPLYVVKVRDEVEGLSIPRIATVHAQPILLIL